MELTRLGHSCVRLESHGARLVIDPGAFSAATAIAGADLVLITHEHPDHVVVADLRVALAAGPRLEVWSPPAVVAALTEGFPDLASRVHVAEPGEAFESAGFTVEVLGELHAVVHADVPQVANRAYLVDGAVLHPGDSLTVPTAPVDVLLVPIAAPWLRVSEAIDYVRAVNPRFAVPIHDAICSPEGLTLLDRLFGPQGVGLGGAQYRRIADGEPFAV